MTSREGDGNLLHFAYLRAEGEQAIDELTVTTFDGLERRHACLPFGGKTCRDQRHAGAQIAAIEKASPAQPRGSVDDDAVCVGQKQISSHAAHLLECEQA